MPTRKHSGLRLVPGSMTSIVPYSVGADSIIRPGSLLVATGLRASNARPYILGRGHFFPKSFVFSNAASTASVTAPRKARSSSRRTP